MSKAKGRGNIFIQKASNRLYLKVSHGMVIPERMFVTLLRFFAVFGLIACAASPVLARDLRITIPRPSKLTPVQRLNRAGVDAVVKHQYEKAEGLFYKAYLYDPADPFTLNNLGYISELRGQLD